MKKLVLLSALSIVLTLSASASKRIVVNLSQQRACAYEGAQTVFCGNISSGKPGRRTPTGRFRVLEKDIDHVSSKYPEPNGGAKMHYMLRLTASGIAMHLGHVPNYPASHGCIRMQNGFAQRMYSWAHVGTPVSVIGSAPRRVRRSAFSSGYSSASRGFSSPNDILAEFMGRHVHTHRTHKRSVHKKVPRRHRRYKRKNRRRRTQHTDPLITLSAR